MRKVKLRMNEYHNILKLLDYYSTNYKKSRLIKITRFIYLVIL